MTTPIFDDAGNPVEPKQSDDVVAEAPDGLTAVLKAYIVPGPSKRLHNAAKKKLREDWPTLAKALDRLVEEELLKRL